jgi:hypothetical protein
MLGPTQLQWPYLSTFEQEGYSHMALGYFNSFLDIQFAQHLRRLYYEC